MKKKSNNNCYYKIKVHFSCLIKYKQPTHIDIIIISVFSTDTKMCTLGATSKYVL